MSVRNLLRAEAGGVSVITAVSSVTLFGFAAFATDVGSVYLDSRRLQGTADLAAMAAAQNPAQATALAGATVAVNDWPPTTGINAVTGTYTPSIAIAPAQRFQASRASVNAVRVTLSSSTPLFFGRLFYPNGAMTITRTATAAQTRLASFQIGSRLLALNGGVANALLSGLTGSNVSLSVMDYNALASANVDLLSFADALRTRLNMQAATYDQTLQQRMDAPNALNAVADVLTRDNNRDAAFAMRQLANAAANAGSITHLDQLLDLGPYADLDHIQPSGATSLKVSAMDMANAILEIAGGQRQVQLQLGSNLPGLTTQAWLAIGERPNNSPWLAVTNDDSVIVRTAQMRLYIEARTNLTGALSSLASVRVPVLMELASAQAKLSQIECGLGGSDRMVALSVSPSIGSLTLGDINVSQLNNFQRALNPTAAQMVRAGPISVDGSANVRLGGESWQELRFSGADIDRNTVKSVHTNDAAQATFSSLLGRTNLTVRVGPLSLLGTQAITSGLQGVLTTLGAPLDDVLNTTSALLGLRLGEADLRVNGVRCDGAALVA